MVSMASMSKFSMRFASHPHQMGFFKNVIFAAVLYVMLPARPVQLTKITSFANLKKRGLVIGCLALSQLFVSKTLPISVTATINALSPLTSSLLAVPFLGEKLSKKSIALLMAAGFGTFICSKPPILTGIVTKPFTTMQYAAILVAICQVFVRSGMMIFQRTMRAAGATTDHFKTIMFYDSLVSLSSILLSVIVMGTESKILYVLPDLKMIGLIAFVALLNQFRPYLQNAGNMNLPVSISSVLGCTNVLFSVFYSIMLFKDNSVDITYGVGTAIVLTSCTLQTITASADKGGKKKKA